MALLLVWHDEGSAIAPDPALAIDRFELRPGLTLVESDLGLSPLYHRIKWALPPGSPLLVAPLAAAPKFKLMANGTQKWLRRTGTAAPRRRGFGRRRRRLTVRFGTHAFARINNLDQHDSGERRARSGRLIPVRNNSDHSR